MMNELFEVIVLFYSALAVDMHPGISMHHRPISNHRRHFSLPGKSNLERFILMFIAQDQTLKIHQSQGRRHPLLTTITSKKMTRSPHLPRSMTLVN